MTPDTAGAINVSTREASGIWVFDDESALVE